MNGFNDLCDAAERWIDGHLAAEMGEAAPSEHNQTPYAVGFRAYLMKHPRFSASIT